MAAHRYAAFLALLAAFLALTTIISPASAPLVTRYVPLASGRAVSRCVTRAGQTESGTSRRRASSQALAGSLLLGRLAQSIVSPAEAITGSGVQGLGDMDDEGYRLYVRPYGASASGGMRAISQGKGDFPPYKFRVPDGWKQKPVSVADPSGPETDARWISSEMGDLLVVLPPVFTFIDDEDSIDTVTLEEIAKPRELLPVFAPQALGIGIEEDGEDIVATKTVKKNGLTYYEYEVKPHSLVSVTVYKGRVYVLSVKASQPQWARSEKQLRKIMESFEVVQT